MKNKQLNLIIKENIDSYIGNIIAENQQQEGNPVIDAIKGGYDRFKDWRRIHGNDAVIDGDEVHFKNQGDEDAHRKTYQKADPNKSLLRNVWDGMRLGTDVGRVTGSRDYWLGRDGESLDPNDTSFYTQQRDTALDKMRSSDAYKSRILNKRQPTERQKRASELSKYGYVNGTYGNEEPNNDEYVYTNDKQQNATSNNNVTSNVTDYGYASNPTQGNINMGDNNGTIQDFDISKNTDGYLHQHQEEPKRKEQQDNVQVEIPKKERLKPLTFNKGDKFSYTTKVDNDSSIKVNKVDPKGKQLVVTNTYPISARKLTTFLNRKGALNNTINEIVRREILKMI